MAVKFGLFVPQGWKLDLVGIEDPFAQYEAMSKVGQVAEEVGFDSIWLYDHFHTVPIPTPESTFEAWTATAGLVRDTKTIQVGQMVTCNGYRHPAVLAKMASSVDAMSNGRLICGLGAGWYEHEWNAYGLEYPETPVRMGMFREACEIVSRMWTEDDVVFNGKYYHIDKPINLPRGKRQPHPEFWLGGGGEKVTLKLVAKYADGCNIGGGNPDVIKQKIEVLKGHCETLGRDINEITISTSLPNLRLIKDGEDPNEIPSWVKGSLTPEIYSKQVTAVTADQLSEQIEATINAGANHILLYMAGVAYEHETIYRIANEVLPKFR